MIHRSTRAMAAAAALAVAVILSACSAPTPTATETSSGDAPVDIRLASVRATPCAPVEQWEEFLPEGSSVEVTYFTSAGDIAQALLSGSADFACIGVTIALVANEQGQPLRVIAQTATKGTAIVAGTDSGIDSIEDLRGKTIANAANSIHDVLLREMLTEAGMDPLTDVNLVNVALPDMPAALCNGDIDAFAGNEPNSSVALLQGCGETITDPYETAIGDINLGLLTTQPFIDAHPDVVQTVVDAHAASVEALQADPAFALEVAGEWGFDLEAAEASFANLGFAWIVDDAFIAKYAAFAERVASLGVTTSVVDVEPIVVTDFAEARG